MALRCRSMAIEARRGWVKGLAGLRIFGFLLVLGDCLEYSLDSFFRRRHRAGLEAHQSAQVDSMTQGELSEVLCGQVGFDFSVGHGLQL